ncbi:isochorismate pyruvate lyase [Rhodovulum iodosum]|uniref:chorismate mutase n=1 Tax=Rhodovulum iodosum TaxID=68291 RepID=A0ABV3XW93_9RHOB|nr:chorismate mutase [Rhodovulum robiginosum]RSK36778.1 chorismate mutase family protein [Rhodovulum robiginosum]
MRAPEECRSMAELRAEIDRLDRALVAMLAERAGYIDRAAALKPGEGLPARIGNRIDEVIGNVRGSAVKAGLDPALAETLWRELIEWAIAREEAAMGAKENRA